MLLSEDQAFVDPQFANSMAWPFGSLTIDNFASNGFIGCATLAGDDVPAALTALAEANQLTTYELDGEEHRILARPLIPGETPCAMLER